MSSSRNLVDFVLVAHLSMVFSLHSVKAELGFSFPLWGVEGISKGLKS